MNNPRTRRPAKAFSLAEILISTGIFSMLGGMILTLMVSVTHSLFDSRSKGESDVNLRSTSSALSQIIGASDFVYVMNKVVHSDKTVTLEVAPPNTGGDLFVAVYYRNPGQIDPATGTTDTAIARIAGFCRLPGPDGNTEGGPLYMFDSAKHSWTDKDGAAITYPVAFNETPEAIIKLLPDAAKIAGFTKLADSAFSTDASKKIFIGNSARTGALMLARIRNGAPGRYVSNNYAFSVASRNL